MNSSVKTIQNLNNEELQKDIPQNASWHSKVKYNIYKNFYIKSKKKENKKNSIMKVHIFI